MDKLITSPSPHIFTRDTTTSIMLNVILALLPAAIASVVFFGARSIAVIAVCIIAAAASEALFNLCCKKKQSIGGTSARFEPAVNNTAVAGSCRCGVLDSGGKVPVRRNRTELCKPRYHGTNIYAHRIFKHHDRKRFPAVG